jgi:hypothetical protein
MAHRTARDNGNNAIGGRFEQVNETNTVSTVWEIMAPAGGC